MMTQLRFYLDFLLRAGAAPMEFHVSRQARRRYRLDGTFFALDGHLLLADFEQVQRLTQKINQIRDVKNHPEQGLRSGDLFAAGLLEEILHLLIAVYREEVKPDIFAKALDYLQKSIGSEAQDAGFEKFCDAFPPLAVYRGDLPVEAYLNSSSQGVPHRHLVTEELLMLYLNNVNPGYKPFLDLIDDAVLSDSAYPEIIDALEAFFDTQPGFGPEDESLFNLLRAPALASPDSLEGQLEYIRGHWAEFLGSRFASLLNRILRTLDIIKEEQKWGLPGGPGPSEVLDIASLRGEGFARASGPIEYERYSSDSSWMPRVVVIAKSTYVWLDQLSKQYRQDIHRLDQIPDEELDKLADWGFTGLWLIGLWERSEASRRIKHLRGNPDAVASAYALYDYQIATDLGGDEAYANLRDRAWQRGIRLASDMVPNHVGIDGRWVIEHPDWFLSLAHSPYPGYSFNGPDLSSDDRVGIYLEDHYYDSSDAAVVFKRVDHWSGDTRYIYHGNDGTSMPWNDTAQINYLNAEAREAVIQTILHVARKFPIIRFDAAMTLAKQHIQRLWFPEPGSGGAIPSRSQYGLTKELFDQVMPEEFWREVVDRVAQEVPDTLLLAEAFWMMEGYFVRTLGMHRVYNSAFMNMLKREENGKYRQSIKNVLTFGPEVLKRFVNFMNNPDEETAVAQFGKDDKYFGVCILMVTMPGLPMFGHGQIEGYTEKYGMEYRRAKYDEQPDSGLIERHEREIFPLLHRREQFAEVENFHLYDLFTLEGHVNEDVFAYSNRVGDQASLVIYNNRFSQARGWMNTAVPYSVRTGQGDERRMVSKTLGEGLALRANERDFVVFRDAVNGLEYLRSSRDLAQQGMYVELEAFKYQVFLDFREREDNIYDHYAQLNAELSGRGVPSIDKALEDFRLKPLHEAFAQVLDGRLLSRLQAPQDVVRQKQLMSELNAAYKAFLLQARDYGSKGQEEALLGRFNDGLVALQKLKTLPPELQAKFELNKKDYAVLLAWIALHSVGHGDGPAELAAGSVALLERWRLARALKSAFMALGYAATEARDMSRLVHLLTRYQHWFRAPKMNARQTVLVLLEQFLDNKRALRYLKVNEHDGVKWFNREAYRELYRGFLLLAMLDSHLEQAAVAHILELEQEFAAAEKRSEYRLKRLLEPKNVEQNGTPPSESL